MPRKKSEPTCGFCARKQQEVGILLEGKLPNHYICEHCTRISMKIIEQEAGKRFSTPQSLIPKEIVQKLDEFVIGE